MSKMKRFIICYYPVLAVFLCLLFVVWWLIPLPHVIDDYGIVRLTGFIGITAFFVIHGIVGFILAYKGLAMFDLAAAMFYFPVAALIAHTSPLPHAIVLLVLWFTVTGWFAYISWNRFSV